ncbi:hypothetical protein [Luteipulveratus halotolerans]|uniref:Uncharacterized protein n=1 Tax=Luteipulveratus halotolerans TaxID=1631356 RepID=A0A0L6CMD4_9MICO|nr:hypothetical protein [Luteipulveratus halotolerans]KNX38805.1 hypothetical protein VV01_19355 [Luteipulveratus halotolerans]
MALRLIGTAATGYRTTDHRDEIAMLRVSARFRERSLLEHRARLAAAALLACHDDTSISLDDWIEPRALVEYLLGRPILKNQI